MSDRISIKGKGAELFYGEEPNADAETAPPTSTSAEPDARQTDSLVASKTDGGQDTKTDSKTERQTDSQEAWPAETVRRLRDALREDHPVHNTFRYPQATLDAVRDIVYELEVKRRVKTTRNDVMRLALAWVIDDYGAHGADSLLVAVLKEERWRPSR